MSLTMRFAAAVRLQLIEFTSEVKTCIVHTHGSPHNEPDSVRAEWSDGERAHAGLYDPKGREAGYAIRIEPREAWPAVIYATRADVVPLALFAASYMLDPYSAPGGLTPGLTTWYTSAAEEKCPNSAMASGNMLPEAYSDRQSGAAGMFANPEFWSLVLSLRADPASRATASRLAELVLASRFTRLAALLRADPRAALRLLPTKAACPARFNRCVPA